MVTALLVAAQLAGTASPPHAEAPLTLREAIAAARLSPRRLAAGAAAAGAEETWRQSGRFLNPAIDVRGENLAADADRVSRDVFALFTQPFELGGKRAARRDIAGAERDVAVATDHEINRRVTLDVVRWYLQVLRAREVVEALEANRSGFTTLVDTMSRRVAEGFAAESDLLKFKTEAARVDVEIARARLDLGRAAAALTAATASPAPIAPARLVEPPPLAPPPGDAGALASAAVANLPEILAARGRLERARQVLALEHARRLPDPAVTGGYKRTAGQNTGVFGVSLAVPLFDQNGASRARADADVRVATLELETLTRQLTAEMTASLEAASALAARAEQAAAELLQPAEGVRNAARAQFREGTTDVLKLIDAERVYVDVRRVTLDLKLDAFLAAVEARFALLQEDLP